MEKRTASYLVRTAMMTAILVILSWIAIPTPWGVPFTLQTFAVALCGYLLGAYGGGCAVLCYLALGAVGIPVFSGFHGSLGALLGLTGGYLIGFLPMVVFIGIGSRKSGVASLLFSAAGLLLCHLFGAFWFSFIGKMSLGKAIVVASLPYLWKDILSIFLADRLAKRRFHKKTR